MTITLTYITRTLISHLYRLSIAKSKKVRYVKAAEVVEGKDLNSCDELQTP